MSETKPALTQEREVFRRQMPGDPLARDPTVPSFPASEPQQAPNEPSLLRDVLALLLKVGIILLVVVLLFTFMYGLHRTIDPSMKPALQDGDLIIFYRLDKTYRPNDVVILDYQGQRQARRVVATAGDMVDITENGLLINGSLQQELGIYETTQRYNEGISFPLMVGEGQVFVLSDAREGSTDSRIYGPVEIKDTLGKAITVLRRRNI